MPNGKINETLFEINKINESFSFYFLHTVHFPIKTFILKKYICLAKKLFMVIEKKDKINYILDVFEAMIIIIIKKKCSVSNSIYNFIHLNAFHLTNSEYSSVSSL